MFASSQPSPPQPAALLSLTSGCGSTANKVWASVCCGKMSSSKRSAHSFNPSHSWPHATPQGLAAAQPHPASSVSSCGLHPFISRIIFSFLRPRLVLTKLEWSMQNWALTQALTPPPCVLSFYGKRAVCPSPTCFSFAPRIPASSLSMHGTKQSMTIFSVSVL